MLGSLEDRVFYEDKFHSVCALITNPHTASVQNGLSGEVSGHRRRQHSQRTACCAVASTAAPDTNTPRSVPRSASRSTAWHRRTAAATSSAGSTWLGLR